MLNKLQFQNLAELQLQNLDQPLCSKSEQMFGFMTKPQLPNQQQTVANTIFFININNSNNFNKFLVASCHLYMPGSHQSSLLNGSESVSQLVSQLVTSLANDRTRVR